MNNDELLKFRNRYEREVKNNEIALAKKQEVLKLLENPDVKRFLSLKKYLDFEEKTFSEMVGDSFRGVKINRNNSNNILVYVGTYNLNNEFVIDKRIKKGYKTYLDLETMLAFNINLRKVCEFEKNNTVIYVSDNYHTSQEYMNDFFKLRNYFFERLVSCSQEEVIEELKY